MLRNLIAAKRFRSMRKVVDSNYLGTKELRDYLAASSENKAVITDYAEMEMLKAETLEAFLKSTDILAQYPKQALLAKTTGVAANLRGRKKGLKKRLTDKKRTRTFRNWCRRREQIKKGDHAFEEERKRARAEAIGHLDHMFVNIKGLKDDLDAHAAQHYTADELSILRTRKPLTPALEAKLFDGIMDFALKLFGANPDQHELPPAAELPYAFTFRFALCANLHALHWIAAGGAKDRKLEKFRNDLVDVAFVAFATCFDGLLSNDKLANEIYDNAMLLLKDGFLKKEVQPIRRRKPR
jgi:hypothetical protein